MVFNSALAFAILPKERKNNKLKIKACMTEIAQGLPQWDVAHVKLLAVMAALHIFVHDTPTSAAKSFNCVEFSFLGRHVKWTKQWAS
jgi:hypothetical protein